MSSYPSSSPPSSPMTPAAAGLPLESVTIPDVSNEQFPLNTHSGKRVNFSDIPFPASSSPVKPKKNNIIKSILKSKVDLSASSNTCAPAKDGKSVLTSDDMLTQSTWYTSDRANHPTLEVMLETACQALEKNIHEKKFEIYCSINSALRLNEKSNHTIQALVNHSQKLVTFAKRDLLDTELSPNPLDKRVSIQAIKMVAYIFFVEGTADVVDNEIIKWFLVHSIEALENQVSTKSIVGAHLHLLTNHRLPSPKVVNIDICGKFLTAIGRMKTFQSVSILSESFMAYDSLLITSAGRTVLLKRLADWLPRTLSSMVDGNSLIRQKALYVMQTCNRVFLGDRNVAKFAMITFSKPLTSRYEIERIRSCNNVERVSVNSPVREDDSSVSIDYSIATADVTSSAELIPKIIDLYHQRLCDLLKDQAEGKICMEIWTRIILLLQCWGPAPEDRFDKWEYMSKWLDIGKKGFNSPFLTTRIAAVSMWKYVVYVWAYQPFCQYPGNKIVSLKKNINFIIHPLRLLSDSRFQLIDTLNICVITMLYACIRPCANAQLTNIQLKITWDKLVVPVFESYYLESTHEYTRSLGFQILLHLFGSSKTPAPVTGSWSLERIIFGDQLTLEDIPPLTPKWVHSNPESVLKMIEVVFDKTKWKCEKISGYIGIELWKKYLAAIKLSIQREVQVSTETLDTVAAVCNFIKRLWVSPISMPYSSVAYFIHTAIENIGIRPFTQDAFTINERGFLVTNIHSRGNKLNDNNNKVGGAVVFLWDFILGLTCPIALANNTAQWINYNRLATEYIAYVLSKLRTSKRRKCYLFLGITLSSLTCKTRNSEENYEEELRCEILIKESLWFTIVNEIIVLMRTTLEDLSQRSFQLVEFNFKDCTKLALEWPIKVGSSNPRDMTTWNTLLDLSFSIMSNDSFSSEWEKVVVEPLCLYILQESELSSQANLSMAVSLIEKVALKKGNASENSSINKMLSPVPKSPSSLGSLSNLNKLIRRLLEDWYDSLYYCKSSSDVLDTGFKTINGLIVASTDLMQRFESQIQLYSFALELLPSFSIWFKDSTKILKSGVTTSVPNGNLTKLKDSIKFLHSIVIKILLTSPKFNNTFLSQIACLVVGGFKSSDESMIKETIEFWNVSFGLNDQLIYPREVAIALSRIAPMRPDLVLPSPISSNIIQEVGRINSSSQTSFLDNFNEIKKEDSPLVGISDAMESLQSSCETIDEPIAVLKGISEEGLLSHNGVNNDNDNILIKEDPQTPQPKFKKSHVIISNQIGSDIATIKSNSSSHDVSISKMRLRSGRTVDSGNSPSKRTKDTTVINQDATVSQPTDGSLDFVLKNGVSKISFPVLHRLDGGRVIRDNGNSDLSSCDGEESPQSNKKRRRSPRRKTKETEDALLHPGIDDDLPPTILIEEDFKVSKSVDTRVISDTGSGIDKPNSVRGQAILVDDLIGMEDLSSKVNLRRSTRHTKSPSIEESSNELEGDKNDDFIYLPIIGDSDARNDEDASHILDDKISLSGPIKLDRNMSRSPTKSSINMTPDLAQSPSKARLLRSSFKKEKESASLPLSMIDATVLRVDDTFVDSEPQIPSDTGMIYCNTDNTCFSDTAFVPEVISELTGDNIVFDGSNDIDSSPSKQTPKSKKRRKTRVKKLKKDEPLTNLSLKEDVHSNSQNNSRESDQHAGESSNLNDTLPKDISISCVNLESKKRELPGYSNNSESPIKRGRGSGLTYESFNADRFEIKNLFGDISVDGHFTKPSNIESLSSPMTHLDTAIDSPIDVKVPHPQKYEMGHRVSISLSHNPPPVDNQVTGIQSRTKLSKDEIIGNLASLVSSLEVNEGNILGQITDEDRFRIEGLLMEALWRTRNINNVKKEHPH